MRVWFAEVNAMCLRETSLITRTNKNAPLLEEWGIGF